MTKMRRLASLLLAVIMVFGLATSAFAAEPGSITITNAFVGQEYSVYRIFDLDSYDADKEAYVYKVNSLWTEFAEGEDINGVYLDIDEEGYVTWRENVDVADFAAKAITYATDNDIEATGSATAAAPADDQEATRVALVINELALGYYLVDSTAGTLCSLNTTSPDVEITDKNDVPDVPKEVKEDSKPDLEAWGEANDADITQPVEFRGSFKVEKGAENYTLQDNMSSGLTFDPTSVKVYADNVLVDAANYQVIVDDPATEEDETEYTFEVAFKNEYIQELEVGTEILVTYSATLNDDAVVGIEGNPNDLRIEYGDKNKPSHSPWDETITYTWEISILKYGDNDKTNILEGAEFVLLNEDGLVGKFADGKFAGWYPNAKDSTTGEGSEVETVVGALDENGDFKSDFVLSTDAAGKILIEGLDSDTYALREIKAPAGYNKLTDDIDVIVRSVETNDAGEFVHTPAEAEVNNNKGPELPETGGIGTTIFYIVGGILVVAAVVLLVTRKRMDRE